MALLIKNLQGLAYASVKSRNGLAVASVKSINGLDATSAGYEFTETFEGSTPDDQSNVGYDNSGWLAFQPNNPPVPHYATSPAPLEGSFSLKGGVGGFDSISRTAGFTASANLNVYFMLNIAGSWNGGGGNLFWFRGAGAVVVLNLFIATASGRFDICSQATQTSEANATGYATLNTYHIWLEYVKGTGANSEGKLYVSTTSTKPGSPTASFNTGIATLNASEIVIFGGDSTAVIDRLIVDGTQIIGSNP
jgi:hypothetical protein